MKYIITGKNIELTEALKEKAISKMGMLEKFFNSETVAHITMSVQKTRQIVEVTIRFHGIILRAEEHEQDMYASIDKVIDVLERQIRKNKTKLSKKLHSSAAKSFEMNWDNSETKDVTEENEFTILRSKKFAVKPMSVEEAVLQMNLVGHAFFMFFNADTGKVNVVYKRKDGNYGLIEPEFEN